MNVSKQRLTWETLDVCQKDCIIVGPKETVGFSVSVERFDS